MCHYHATRLLLGRRQTPGARLSSANTVSNSRWLNLLLCWHRIYMKVNLFRLSMDRGGTHISKYLKWTNLNPTRMLEEMKTVGFNFPFKTLEDYMKRSGITNGYQGKPCLNPKDPECPETAPNKKTGEVRILNIQY